MWALPAAPCSWPAAQSRAVSRTKEVTEMRFLWEGRAKLAFTCPHLLPAQAARRGEVGQCSEGTVSQRSASGDPKGTHPWRAVDGPSCPSGGLCVPPQPRLHAALALAHRHTLSDSDVPSLNGSGCP